MPQRLQLGSGVYTLCTVPSLLIRFNQAIKNFAGGSDTFFSMVMTSAISSADSLLPHLEIAVPPGLPTYLSALRAATGDITLTFDMLVERFLRGRGTPCPLLFAEAKSAFHPIIDLERIDTAGFRARALAWAATGSPYVDPAEGRIIVSSHRWVLFQLTLHPSSALLACGTRAMARLLRVKSWQSTALSSFALACVQLCTPSST